MDPNPSLEHQSSSDSFNGAVASSEADAGETKEVKQGTDTESSHDPGSLSRENSKNDSVSPDRDEEENEGADPADQDEADQYKVYFYDSKVVRIVNTSKLGREISKIVLFL